MKKKSLIHKVTKIIVDITFILGMITCLLVPYIVNYLGDKWHFRSSYRIELMIFLVISGLIAVYMVFLLRKILKNVVLNNPFTLETVNSLRKIALCSAIIGIIYIVKLFINFSIGTMLIVIVFTILTLLFLTLKDLFKQALFYKEESDYTI